MKCSLVAVVAVALLAGCTSRGDDETPAGQEHPDWSPEGSRLVFSRDGNLFTVPADGGDPVQVTALDGVTEHAIQPTFTPDGDGIVFTYVTGRWGVDDSPSAALIGLDGSGFEVLAQGVAATHPRLRPGRSIPISLGCGTL